MILVTDATGDVGSALLPALSRTGAAVRALAHSPASRGSVERHGVEAVDGDFDRPETLEAAMAGCDHVFLLSPVRPDQPGREKAAVDAAKRAGVRHVVALSATGSDHSSSMPFSRWHAEIDDHLVASGLDYTILRPSGLMQLHLLPVETAKAQGRWYGMTGDGAHGYIDAGDVAAAAAAVLTSAGHTGRTYELTGPEAMTMPQASAQLSEAIGREVVYVDVPADQFRASLVAAGLPDWLTDAIVALYTTIREGHAATVSNSVEELTGHPARSYRQVVEDHKDAFTVA